MDVVAVKEVVGGLFVALGFVLAGVVAWVVVLLKRDVCEMYGGCPK
jgi:uncharacterized membrane protein YccF (DUF307 family)